MHFLFLSLKLTLLASRLQTEPLIGVGSMNSNFSDIAVILPELLLAVMGMALLIWGAFRGNRDFHVITLTAAALMFAAENGHDQVRSSQLDYVDSCRQLL